MNAVDGSAQLLLDWKAGGTEDAGFQAALLATIRDPLARGARAGLTVVLQRNFFGEDVDDAASEAAVVVFAHDPNEITTGIEQLAYGVAYNKGRDVGRRLASLRRHESEVAVPEGKNPADVVVENEGRSDLSKHFERCWSALHQKQQEVIEFVELNNGRFVDWAAANGVSPQAAKQRCDRGKESLRNCLIKAGFQT